MVIDEKQVAIFLHPTQEIALRNLAAIIGSGERCTILSVHKKGIATHLSAFGIGDASEFSVVVVYFHG